MKRRRRIVNHERRSRYRRLRTEWVFRSAPERLPPDLTAARPQPIRMRHGLRGTLQFSGRVGPGRCTAWSGVLISVAVTPRISATGEAADSVCNSAQYANPVTRPIGSLPIISRALNSGRGSSLLPFSSHATESKWKRLGTYRPKGANVAWAQPRSLSTNPLTRATVAVEKQNRVR
jgi:hypothetical protein